MGGDELLNSGCIFFVALLRCLQAIIYNDISPLENFHSCLCFRILERCEELAFCRITAVFLSNTRTSRHRIQLN